MGLPAIERALARECLTVLGGFHPGPGDGAPEGCATLLMVGPDEPAFWPHFTASPECGDGAPDPLDRWSVRVLSDVADRCGAAALFPFGGPPWHPFIGWALTTRRAWVSPVGLLVHDVAGLFVSFRGALAVPRQLELPPPPRNPCDSCAERPCTTACPPAALTPAGYDVPACRAFLDAAAGASCLSRGCAVRRACPVGADRRTAAQSAFHMKAFAR